MNLSRFFKHTTQKCSNQDHDWHAHIDYKDPIELPCDQSVCLQHLSERERDEHSEELKKRMDDIFLAMIEQTKKYEKIFLNRRASLA